MNGEHKVSLRHRQRLAAVYVRQSTLAQVRMNTESTARQYGLAEAAVALGWDRSQVLVLDGDLGRSGSSALLRSDFKELVSRVCQGEVGLVLVLEASRLSRNSADFQRLLEFCQVTDTLVADADGIYDLRDFNDQLLLGFKGTMSAVELHVLAQRMQEAKRAAARRGDLHLPLPIGYVYDNVGQTVIDPDEEVRTALADVFRAFEASGSGCGVVKAFQQRRFPSRVPTWTGEVVWGRLKHSQVLAILRNPTYAGAYVSGRRRSERWVDAEGLIRTRQLVLPQEQWAVVLHDRHEAYIRWDVFAANQRRLTANRPTHEARPPREGSALLQGLVLCGRCGRPMDVQYGGSGRPHYRCQRSRMDRMALPGCRSINAALVDPAVSRRLLEVVTPDQIALAIAAADELTQREARALRALALRGERAGYEASRAERAFHLCEPENRLVARSLEQRWEAKLVTVEEAERVLQTARASQVPLPAASDLEGLASDLPKLWSESTTSNRDRKRILRTLVADVALTSDVVGDQVRIGIRWQSGSAEEQVVARSRMRTDSEAVELVRQLTLAGKRDEDIAAELRGAGLATARGHHFGANAVRGLRHVLGVARPEARAAGELSVAEVAGRLGISDATVYYWTKHGLLSARHAGRRVYVPFPTEVEEACRQRAKASSHLHRSILPQDRSACGYVPPADSEVTHRAADLGAAQGVALVEQTA